MPDILITEFMDEAAVKELSDAFDTRYDPTLVETPDQIESLIEDARALIVRNRTQVSAELLSSARNLTCVGRLGVGLDNIDQDYCAARNIRVFPATGANDQSVAEYVVTMALVLLRGAYLATDQMRAGTWPRQSLMGRECAGRTLGLIGFGKIARETAARARALGMNVVAADPHLSGGDPIWDQVTRLSQAEVLATADVISLHVPLTDETRGMIGPEQIAQMRKGAILINAARGGVVQDTAVADGLRSGQLSGAALDVFQNEPLTAQAGAVFDGLNNVILTPHIAGVTQESNKRVSVLIAKRVAAHLGGI